MSSNARFWIVGGAVFTLNLLGLSMIYKEVRRPDSPPASAASDSPQTAAPYASAASAAAPPVQIAAQPSAQPAAAAADAPKPTEPAKAPAAPSPTPDLTTPRVIKWSKSSQGETQSQIVFYVEPAVPETIETGRPTDAAPLVISPAPEGRWLWRNRATLVYNLKQPLPPGRRYNVTLSPDAQKILGVPVSLGEPIVMETRPLEITGKELEEIDLTTLRAHIGFNQKVRPEDLQNALAITINGEELAFRITADGPTWTLPVEFPKREAAEVEFKLAETLKGDGADFGFKGAESFTLRLPDKFAVMSASIDQINSQYRSLRDGVPWQSVRIIFNKLLDPRQKTPTVSAEPDIPNLQVGFAGRNLTLTGEMQVNQPYKLKVSSETVAFTGERLEERNATTFTLPPMPPGVEFAQSDGILSTQGDMAVEIRAVGTSKIQLQTWRLVPANLVAFLQDRGRYWWEDSYEYYECEDCDENSNPGATPGDESAGVVWYDQNRRRPYRANSVPVFNKSYAVTANQANPTTHALDLRKIFGESARGIYRLRVGLNNNYYYGYSNSNTLTVAISDLALSAKRARQETLVWVTSIAQGAPEPGVEVQALSYFNQVIATATTDANGVARLATSYDSLEKDPYVLVARKGDDYNYLMPEQGRWRLEDLELGGAPLPTNYEATLYPERGVYRPGEVIQASGIIRDAEGRTPDPFPLLLSLIRSDGKVLARQTTLPLATASGQGQGFFHTALVVPDDAWTGSYRITAEIPGDKRPLATTKALVEEFSPVRLAVDAEVTTDSLAGTVEVRDVGSVGLITTNAPKFNVAAKYLFGSPAGESPVRVTGEFLRAPISPPGLREFVFDNTGSTDRQPAGMVEGKLDAEGRATLALEPPKDLAKSHWAARFTATVRDKGGRSVSKNFDFRYDNVGRHIGGRLEGQVFRPGEPMRIEWVQVDPSGAPVAPAPINVRIERLVWDYQYVTRDNGAVRWESRQYTREVSSRRFDPPADGAARGILEISAPDYGQHKIHLTDTSTNATTTLDVWIGWGGEEERIALGRPERLEIALDKRSYKPGDNAVALIRSPFPGRALLSVETDRILHTQFVDIGAGSTSVTLPVTPGKMRSGAYLTASVIRPLELSNPVWKPRRALGMEHLPIDPEAYALPLVLEAPDNVYPGDTFDVLAAVPPDTLEGQPPAEIHLWAVDEGILLTTDYKTPDPLKTFYVKRRAEIYSADNYNDLLPDYARPETMERIGAGDDGEGGRASSVVLRDRREGVIWRVAAPVDADGKLRATITAPETVGKIRVMAVAARGENFGRAERGVTISQPLMIEVSSPRFTAPGDEFELPVKLFNTTDKPVRANIETAIQGPLEVTLGEGASVELGPTETRMLTAKARTTNLGPIHLELKASYATSEGVATSRAKSDFPSRPTSKPLIENRATRIDAGQEVEFPLAASFVPNSAERIIRVSARPELELAPALEHLISYPWGCVEQVSSRLLGMIRAPETLSRIYAEDERIGHAQSFVQIGIYRLATFQTSDGGLGYWSGGQSVFWPTVYATRMLLQARDAGFEVPEPMMRAIGEYLSAELKRGSTGNRTVSDNELAEALYVMSATGKASEGWLNSVSESVGKMDLEGRSYLARAWLAAGRRDRATLVMPGDDWEKLASSRTLEGRIVSRVTQTAAFLECLLDFDPHHPLAPEVAARLDRDRKHGHWSVTRDNAAAVSALCRYYSTSTANPDFTGEITLGSERREFSSTEPQAFILGRLDGAIRLTSRGTGSIYVSVTDQGLPQSGVLPEEDQHIRARRRWLDAEGRVIGTSQTLKVGDLVWAEITLDSSVGGAHFPNIAVEDALPGCLEAENPKFATSALATSPVVSPSTPDRIEYRDDRVAIFARATNTASRFTYPARVVKAGRFAAPSIHAECMYDPEIRSIHQGDRKIMEAVGQ